MNNLIDGISKAYEIAAPFIQAKVVIKLTDGSTKQIHYMRPIDETKTPDIRYIPAKLDDSQLTELSILPSLTKQQIIYYRMRDKFQFKVGTSLTMYNVKFEMIDSSIYYDTSETKFRDLIVKEDSSKTCTTSAGALANCNTKTTFKIPRSP
jgi:hypothetical protein